MKLRNCALMMAALVGACAHVQKPEVELTGVRVAGVGLKGASLIADLDVRNPNDMTAQTDSIVYELYASTPNQNGGWTRILQSSYGSPISLRSNNTTRVEVPIDFNYADMQGPARAILDRGTFNYRLQGNVYLRSPVRRILPFNKTGNVSLQGVR